MLFELCAPFLNLNDPKEMWRKIDPTYIPSGLRIDLTDETPICNKKEERKSIVFPKEYGTITEFYFLAQQMLHFGLTHIFKKYADIKKLTERLNEDRKAQASN